MTSKKKKEKNSQSEIGLWRKHLKMEVSPDRTRMRNF